MGQASLLAIVFIFRSWKLRPLFTGRQFDHETGLYYYRARYYHPELGRFLQTDPIGYYDSLNLYSYCGNNSVNWADPYGLKFVVHGDKAAFDEAVAYLTQSETFSILYQELEASNRIINVGSLPGEDKNVFKYNAALSTGIIVVLWDPTGALQESMLVGNRKVQTGVVQTPALGLAHELAHVALYMSCGLLDMSLTGDDYGDLEERRVIFGIEAAIARQLGEQLRHSHKGERLAVEGPTKRCKK